jgi:hypothetical protein
MALVILAMRQLESVVLENGQTPINLGPKYSNIGLGLQ